MNDTQLLAMVMAMAGVVITAVILVYVVVAIAYWQIFKKAGEKGWKALIPVYNTYIIFKIAWKTSMFWIMIILGVVYEILWSIAASADITALFVLAYIVYIAVIVISIATLYKLSKAFGHGVPFTLGLIFLSVIFILILAFGSSQYVGNSAPAETIEE